MVRLGVQEADAQVGADAPGVIIGEGPALIGVKLARQAPTLDRLLETLMKRTRVGIEVISRVRHQARMIIQNGAQVRGQGLLLIRHVQKRSR
jgi:hypothetical protein